MPTTRGTGQRPPASCSRFAFDEGDFLVGQPVEFVDKGIDLAVEGGDLLVPILFPEVYRRLAFSVLCPMHSIYRLGQLCPKCVVGR